MSENKTKVVSKIRLTKVSDDFFRGNHPNEIYEGYTIEGYEVVEMKIGERYVLSRTKMYPVFSTSPVKELADSEGVFKTTYSTYKLEILDDLN